MGVEKECLKGNFFDNESKEAQQYRISNKK
jgi:hypothetical protein